MPAVLHNFVRFVFSGEHSDVYRRYFSSNIFKQSPSLSCTSKDQNIIWPSIRKSYVKGFFKGIKVKHIGSQNAFKKTILDILVQYDIIYEITEKSYFCSYFDNDDECYFKISLYFNVIVSEYYLVLTCLNSKTESLKQYMK